MNERDGRVGVVSVGEKDARKGRSQIGKERARVAGRIDRIERILERRKEIELRERVSESTEVAAAHLGRNHLHAGDRL